jgi:hypothetical protein
VRLRAVALTIASSLVACLSIADAQQNQVSIPRIFSCPKPSGFFGGPFVPTERAAKAIYIAIAREIIPEKLREFPVVTAEDLGDHWIVSQTHHYRPKKLPPNSVAVTTGGGQLVMSIDKCAGTVSEVYLAR